MENLPTVILLVGLAVVIALVFSYWVVGLSSTRKYEVLETICWFVNGSGGCVCVEVKSRSGDTVTVNSILVNEVPLDDSCFSSDSDVKDLPFRIEPSDRLVVKLECPPDSVTGGVWVRGVSYQITLQTASGYEFHASVSP